MEPNAPVLRLSAAEEVDARLVGGGDRRSVAELLNEFHTRPGCDQARPLRPTLDVIGGLARAAYINEESQELTDAVLREDLIRVADALGDIVYATYGTAWRFGIDLDAVVREIHRSNMTKIPAPADGKAIKGAGYSPPELERIIYGER